MKTPVFTNLAKLFHREAIGVQKVQLPDVLESYPQYLCHPASLKVNPQSSWFCQTIDARTMEKSKNEDKYIFS